MDVKLSQQQPQKKSGVEPATALSTDNQPPIVNTPLAVGKRSELITVVQEGLKSIQAMQEQTTRAHEKFLDSQTEASRALQKSFMKRLPGL